MPGRLKKERGEKQAIKTGTIGHVVLKKKLCHGSVPVRGSPDLEKRMRKLGEKKEEGPLGEISRYVSEKLPPWKGGLQRERGGRCDTRENTELFPKGREVTLYLGEKRSRK